jgi:hypothetical protein
MSITRKLLKKKPKGGAIVIALPEGVVEVASDDIKESERIVKRMLKHIKAQEKPQNYIR